MTIEHSYCVDAPLEEVFAYHERPGALTRLLPPWLPLRVEKEAASLRDGEAVLRLPGGLRWVARHQEATSPYEFVDELVSPSFKWRHTHTFRAAGDTATQVVDRIETPLPARFLRPTLRYRQDQLTSDLAAHRTAAALLGARPGNRALTIAITGSSGLVGTALSALLSTGGHRVIRLVRGRADDPSMRAWDPTDPKPELFDGVDAVIHLAGSSIGGRFTEAHKNAIRASRVLVTERLSQAMERSTNRPVTLVAASAVGYYGADRGDEILDEAAPPGHGFLAGVVADWEAATQPAGDAGVRVVLVRTGIVQSARGGVLGILRPIFFAGVGGPIADGNQWLSWIDLDDLCDVYYRAVVDIAMEGPVNAVAPHPVRNRDYTAVLARVLRRPAAIRVPAAAMRLLLGSEGAHELALASQQVVPLRLQQAGHDFRWPEIETGLRHQLGRL